MSVLKTYKKGDFLFKEGEKAQSVYLLQSGAVTICLVRPKRNVELFLVASPGVVGDQALQGVSTHAVSAVCNTEVKVVEMPADLYRTQSATLPQAIQAVLKGLVERSKALASEIRSLRLERDTVPVPEDQVARALGIAFHAANYLGKKEGDSVIASWRVIRQYAQRVFAESPKRYEQMINILVKLKLAEWVASTDAADPDPLASVKFFNLPVLESASDFYQHYYFKGGKTDFLKVEDGALNLVQALVICAQNETLDRNGLVRMDYVKLLERIRDEFAITVKSDHWDRLEVKGLFVKRVQGQEGVSVQFELKEFAKMLSNWRILREIERLNDRGFVDMTEETKKVAQVDDKSKCPSCEQEVTPEQKFCGNCGHKLLMAA